ncbi:MAG: hypothetical protein AAB701_02540 [Patescibacteria group bacterium]
MEFTYLESFQLALVTAYIHGSCGLSYLAKMLRTFHFCSKEECAFSVLVIEARALGESVCGRLQLSFLGNQEAEALLRQYLGLREKILEGPSILFDYRD